MRLILSVFGLTITALVFVWRADQMDQMAQWFGGGGQPPSASFAKAPSSAQDDMLETLLAAAVAAMSSGQGSVSSQNSNRMVQLSEPPSSGSMIDDIMSGKVTKDLSKTIQSNMDGFFGESPPRPRTPAMKGSEGARFVKIKPST